MRVARLLCVTAVSAVAAAGCGADDDSAAGASNGEPPPVACTEIGCESGVFLDIGVIKRNLAAAERVKLCLRTRCRTYSLARADLVNLSVKGLREGQRVSVRMVIYGEGGEVLRRSAVRAPVRKVKPNGPRCPPTCFQVPVRIDRQTLRLEVAG